jgi:membrane-associated phospholipid phosphatase
VANPAIAVGPLAGFAFAILAIAGVAAWRPGIRNRTVLALCMSAFSANEINTFVKGLFGRTWPESWLGSNRPGYATASSASSISRRTVLGFISLGPHDGHHRGRDYPLGRLAELKAAWAATVAAVALALIASKYHFVSDVIAGFYFGAGIGLGTAALMLSQTIVSH